MADLFSIPNFLHLNKKKIIWAFAFVALVWMMNTSYIQAQPANLVDNQRPTNTGFQSTTRIFGARDGLPDNKVQMLLETRKSPFRWAITRNELCRFDGYRFQTVWEKMPDIKGIVENSDGQLVISHILESDIISLFDPRTGEKQVKKVAELDGLKDFGGMMIHMWAQDTMIFILIAKPNPKQIQVYRLFPDFKTKFIHSVEANADDINFKYYTFVWDEKNSALWYQHLWYNPSNTIARFDTKTGHLQFIPIPPQKSMSSRSMLDVLPDGSVWIAPNLDGDHLVWNEALHQFERGYSTPNIDLTMDNYFGCDQNGVMIFQKITGSQRDLWIRYSNGSWKQLKGDWSNYHISYAVGQDFSRQILFCSLEGVVRVNFEKSLFKNFIPPAEKEWHFPFRGITADKENNILMLSEMVGLFRLTHGDGHGGKKVNLKNTGINTEALTSLAGGMQTDKDGKIWAVREGGTMCNLMRLDPQTEVMDTFLVGNSAATAFLILSNGGIILGSGNGLFSFNPENGQRQLLAKLGATENLKSSPLFFCENPLGQTWVGSKDGLALFDPNTQKWLNFKGDNSTAHEYPVAVIFQENKKTVWIGTIGGGLRKLDLETGNWEVFTMANGLPANKIAGILPDENGNFWISTYDGLSFFQPKTNLFTNFFTQHGLSHNEFNRFSFFKGTDGVMYFGGLRGVNYFKPSALLGSFSQGNDSLLISQVSYFASDGKTRLEQFFDLQDLKSITLPADNRFCSIRLALANYLQPEANRFTWKLEGHDKEWHLNGTNNEILFHYLPAGTYQLRIKAANPTGVWGSTERVIEIRVGEFWYKTWWFFGLLGMTMAGLFYLYYFYQIKQRLEHAENLKIKELDSLKTRLYTNITHEFRTPLTVIMGMTDNIQGHEQEKKLISRNSQNLLRLINQLLDLSKLDSGMLKLNLVHGDIINYLQYLTESFYSMAQEKKIRLVFYPEMEALNMDFDEEKVQHIIYNLLSNALKFTGEGGKVVLHAKKIEEPTTSFLQLKIQDTGVGISAAELPHIFDRFYQTDQSSTRKGEGTGIGLALTKELVNLMGGSIMAESTPDRGTTFIALLPIRLDHNDIEKTIKAKMMPVPETALTQDQYLHAVAPVGSPTDVEKPVLLIIEDNADVVTYIIGILTNDYSIEVARNGQLGIEKALDIVPDIIISDVMMPEKDGYEVCDTLKNDERTSHIPIILLTAKATQEDKLVGLKVGADAYLQKPFDKTELLIRLEKLLELRQRLQERYTGNTGFAHLPKHTKSGAQPTLDDIFLQKIRQVIEDKMGESEFGILHLCRAVNLGHTQVFRKMKALTCDNPTIFIRKMRLQKALHLLQTTELNISEIAYDVGFSDPNYFTRAFHEHFGESPSAMRLKK